MKPLLTASVLGLCLSTFANAASPQTADRKSKACAECTEMVVVPAGSYLMGSAVLDVASNPKAWQPNTDELPQHNVFLKSFRLGKYEVTQDQWFAVMGSAPSFNRGGTLPVETVSWNDVQRFIAKLNEKTGQNYRLPTESEWEYAARAGSSTAFSFGDDPAQLEQYAWYSDNSGKKAHPVGEKVPNKFGLYDMHGNVWEWVQDCYAPTYVGAPTDGSAVPERPGCERVIRDGSGVDFPKSLRSAERYKNSPDYSNGNLGFRLALTLP